MTLLRRDQFDVFIYDVANLLERFPVLVRFVVVFIDRDDDAKDVEGEHYSGDVVKDCHYFPRFLVMIMPINVNVTNAQATDAIVL